MSNKRLISSASIATVKARADERYRLRQLLFGKAHQQTALHFGGCSGESLAQILRRPEVSVAAVVARLGKGIFSAAAMTAVEKEIKYAGYIFGRLVCKDFTCYSSGKKE